MPKQTTADEVIAVLSAHSPNRRVDSSLSARFATWTQLLVLRAGKRVGLVRPADILRAMAYIGAQYVFDSGMVHAPDDVRNAASGAPTQGEPTRFAGKNVALPVDRHAAMDGLTFEELVAEVERRRPDVVVAREGELIDAFERWNSRERNESFSRLRSTGVKRLVETSGRD